MGIVYLHKELEVVLIKTDTNVTDFVNQAVKEKMERENLGGEKWLKSIK